MLAREWMAFFLEWGHGTEKNEEKAAELYQALMDEGSSYAVYALGRMYEEGRGVPQDKVQAVTYYSKSPNYCTAEQSCLVGEAMFGGDGVKQNDQGAFEWFQFAADKGSLRAKEWVAYCFANGRGTEQDIAAALAKYEEACNEGSGYAASQIGKICEEGKGVEQDFDLAGQWYEKAIALNEVLGMNRLASLYFNGQLEGDPARTLALYQQAADLGYVPAMYNVGVCYETGTGTGIDYEAAAEWYRKAAQLGSEEAAWQLKVLETTGKI
jgi:TPR repeat protein